MQTIRGVCLAAMFHAICLAQTTLPAPQQTTPADGIELRTMPREVWLEWQAVPGAETYNLEVDCEGCCVQGKFCSDVPDGHVFRASELQGTKYRSEFAGDQRGRWRVWASAGFIEGEKSPWRTLSVRTAGMPAPPQAPKPLAPLAETPLPVSSTPIVFEWTPVIGAQSYSLEIDRFGTCAATRFCSDVGVYNVIEKITETRYTATLDLPPFVRWRVWAVANNRMSQRSAWLGLRRPVTTQPAPVAAPPNAPAVPPANAPSPEYTEQARAAGLEGTATVFFEVSPSGATQAVKILQGLGMGLDEKAVELVRGRRFDPSKVAPVQAAEVHFRLSPDNAWRVKQTHYGVIRDERLEPESAPPVLTAYQRPDSASCPAGQNTAVPVTFRITKGGAAKNIHADGWPALVRAVEGWKFEPAKLSGHPREANAVFTMECGPPVTSEGAPLNGAVKPPSLLSKVEPEYSDLAREKKFQGDITVQFTVGLDGFAVNLRITKPLGMGLDEKAMEALKRWRFAPATRDGKAVATQASAQINFRLL